MTRLGPDEQDVVALVAARLAMGAKQYGVLNVERDKRVWTDEALEEALDLAVYLAAQLLRRSRRNRRKLRSKLCGKHSTPSGRGSVRRASRAS